MPGFRRPCRHTRKSGVTIRPCEVCGRVVVTPKKRCDEHNGIEGEDTP
jgi:uncharacterized OB-fold protein